MLAVTFGACAPAKKIVPIDTEQSIQIIPAQNVWVNVPPQKEVIEGYVDVEGARLWYWDTGGEGVPIVLVHPVSGSALIWGYQQPEFVDAGFRVIAYSRRGHHGTQVSVTGKMPSASADLLEIAKHLKLEKFHVVGMGGGAGLLSDFAISYPERLLSLVIGCTIGETGDEGYTSSNNTLLPREFWGLPAWLKELGPVYRDSNPTGVQEWIALEEQSSSERIRAPRQNDLKPSSLKEIDLPVLLFTGDADLYMPPSRLRSFSTYWKNPEMAIFLEAGHAPYWEQPIGFNNVVLDFMKRHNGEH
ncbi:MAG: twin-arginine translocation pathway signal protein [Alphaproteobacteria bacterium]|nr:MAG: twin-arginine translocation pathway signal protein [Alphaproteobacteria bacterium]